jgi:nicotinamide-nucleotide amidase
MRNAWVISTGTELALGQSVGTNGAWLAARLAGLGIRTERHVTVPDDAAATCQVLLQAAESCDLILVTGGLGPTEDDLTRQALADAAGLPLEFHAPSLERLRAFFAARGREMPERNRVQALAPKSAGVLPNTCGTAPGLRVELRGTPCYALPGVPFEMRTMFDRDVEPHLNAAGEGAILLSRRMHTCGLGESDIGECLSDLMQRGRNPEVGTTAEFGIVSIRINVLAPSQIEAEAQLAEVEAEIRRRLGETVFGCDEDTLASVVGAQLTSVGQTLSTAESCTGGLIGTLLTDVAGSSQYYRGGVVAYANEAKMRLLGVPPAELDAHGAVSEPVARAMALGAARVFETNYALSVTGIAGPTGGTAQKPVGLVFIGLSTPADTSASQHRFGSDAPREAIRLRAARTALNRLRLSLLEQAPGAHQSRASGR